LNSKSSHHNPAYASYALFLLWLAYILSFVDRQILSLLIGPIRDSFSISDTQFSLLHGLAFAIFYTLLGLPIGRWADRGNRRNIIAAGVALWSAMTCLCGLAKNFSSLFLARIGVGVGEAALSPPAHSLLSDYFSQRRLPLAYAFYSSGIVLGSGLAYIIGGHIYDFFNQLASSGEPWLDNLSAWQATFIAVGLPGIVVALLILTIREPARRGAAVSAGETEVILPIRSVLSYLFQRRQVYGSLILGVSLLSILGYATMSWYPEFLQRSYGLTRADAGMRFGQLFIIAGLLGSLLLALASQWWGSRGVRDINMRIVFFVACLEWLPAMLAPLMPTADTALLLASLLIALQYGYFGIAISALQVITPNQMRAQVSAILLFVTNLLGLVVGPTVVALLTDYLFVGDQYLYLSLSLVSAVVAPLAAWVLWRGVLGYRTALDEAERR